MWTSVPPSVARIVERLVAAGFETALVGGCVRALASHQDPRDWDVATGAPAENTLALFPHAVPIGLRHGTVMVPTAAGPVDVTHLRGPDLAADLGRRDFTMNAAALRPGDTTPHDPHAGLADLDAGVLRAVGSAGDRLAEDPLRALRAARFVAELELSPDEALCAALPGARRGLAGVAAERVRAEIDRLVLGPRAGRAITLLRETGLEDVWIPGARDDVARVVEALPPDRDLRLAAWLRATRVGRVLARLRMPLARRAEIERLLAAHPIDAHMPAHHVGARRLLRRVGTQGADRLIALRCAELEGEGPLRDAVAQRETLLREVRAGGRLALARGDLAIGGAEVMTALGAGPGPHVGRALGYLLDRVLEDPSANTPERLRILLESYPRPDP